MCTCSEHLYLYLFDLLLNIVRKQSVCVSRRVSIWLRMTLILTRRPIIIFAEKNIQLRFVIGGPVLAQPHARIEAPRIKIYLASKLNHNTLFVLVAVDLEHIDLKLLLSFPQ